ncbi:DUF805 domain-containing protein [bacterium]|nr:DUF805 domain-containing protein [bacterium]
MKHALDLWSWEGRVTRKQYLAAGFVLFVIKYAMDAGVSLAFEKRWTPLMYLSPEQSPLLRPGEAPGYWIALLFVALPFIAAGVSLSARRLRDMGVNPFWCGLFFLPFLHWVFFLVLTIAPGKELEAPAVPGPVEGAPIEAKPAAPVELPEPLFPILARLLPDGRGARFVLGVFAGVLVGGAGLVSAVFVAQAKNSAFPASQALLGIGLFFGVPFGMGFWATFIVNYRRPRDDWALSLIAGVISLLASLVTLMVFAIEGIACIVMAVPILAPIVLLGSFVGYLATRAPKSEAGAVAALLLVAFLLGRDARDPPEPVLLSCATTTHVNAPPERVWRNVTAVSAIDEPPEAIFAICAMPLESTLEGSGVGARRRCILTVGTLEETVVAWEEARELTFRVDSAPARFARYGEVVLGQFRLVPEADGTTTVVGTTWYRCRVHPTAYWSLWTQRFVHAVHARVLEHVKRLSENPDAPLARAPAKQPRWMADANATCKCTRHAEDESSR